MNRHGSKVQQLFRTPLEASATLIFEIVPEPVPSGRVRFSVSPRATRAVTKLTDRRIAHLVRQANQGFPVDSIRQMAARWGVTRRRLEQVVQLAREMGGIPLLKTHRRPRGPPLTAEQAAEIRREHERTPRGPTLLYQSLLRRGVHIPKMKIYELAKAEGWTVPNPRKQRPRRYIRYERKHSGSLLHGDFHRTDEQSPHCILWEDDASRMILSGGEFAEATTELAIQTLVEAMERAHEWNVDIREVNTDRGTQFWASPSSLGVRADHTFATFLDSAGIRHVLSRAHHPQTNGKLERLWLEYDRHRWRFAGLSGFIEWYNDQIHGSLWTRMFETPREAWQRKLPTDVLLGLHARSVEELTP